MSGEIIKNFVGFVAISIKDTGKCSCAYSGDDFRFNIML